MMKNLLFAAALLTMAPAAVFSQVQMNPVHNTLEKKLQKIVIPGTMKKALQATSTVEIGYCNPNSQAMGVGVNGPATLSAGIYLPPSMLPTNEGATIDYITFALSTTNKLSDVSIWIRTDINSDPVYSQEIAVSDLVADWNKIVLDTPYTLTGEGVYVGYTLTTSAQANSEDAYPIGTSGTDAKNGLWIDINGEGFEDYNGADLGVLSLLVGVTGEFPDYDAALTSASATRGIINTPIKVTGEFMNAGLSDLSSVELKYTLNGEEKTTTVNFDTPLKARERATVEFETGTVSESGYYDMDLEITKFNDTDDSNADNNKLTVKDILFLSKSSPRVTVMEEGTGTWCGWCPRGAVGLEKMEKLHGDNFIGIAVHVDDNMQISDYSDIIDVFSGFPQALIDRRYINDPYNYIEDVFNICNSIPSEGEIELSARFLDDNKTLEVTSSSTFYFNTDNNPYRVAYILTEDGLTGSQANYYSGANPSQVEDDLAYLTDEPSTIRDFVFNDVAVGAYACMGIEGSLAGTITDGEAKTHTYTINMPSRIKNISNVTLIAMIVTNSDTSMEIVNATEMPLKDILGVEKVSADKMGVTVEAENGQLTVRANTDKDLTLEVYTAAGTLAEKAAFTGNTTVQLPEGNVYVVRVNDGNNVVVKKVVM